MYVAVVTNPEGEILTVFGYQHVDADCTRDTVNDDLHHYKRKGTKTARAEIWKLDKDGSSSFIERVQ